MTSQQAHEQTAPSSLPSAANAANSITQRATRESSVLTQKVCFPLSQTTKRLLTKAMARGQKQKKQAILNAPKTPKKEKMPERFVIGSSSSWTDEQLERFDVRIEPAVRVNQMIPEKWFDFRGLEHYQSGLLIRRCVALMLSARSTRLHSTRRLTRR